MNKKVGIYGGTFDPVHKGHIALADAACRECKLDRLIFMPDYVSPFKQGEEITSAQDRYKMLEAVLHYNPAFSISAYEITKEGPSYTIETLEHWDAILDDKIYFVLGFDSAVQVDTWRRGEDILRKYPLITAVRPGVDVSGGMAKIEVLRTKYGANINILSMDPVNASSTEIRERVNKGMSITGLVMPETEEYIFEHNLYR